MHASNVHTSLITRISAMSAHGWVRVMLMPNWGGGGVLTKHPLDKATRKQAPGPSWCRPLSRGAEGRCIWPAMTRSATCPTVATSFYSSSPSSGQNPLYPRKLTPTALPFLPGQQKNKSAYGSSRAEHYIVALHGSLHRFQSSHRALQTNQTTKRKHEHNYTKRMTNRIGLIGGLRIRACKMRK